MVQDPLSRIFSKNLRACSGYKAARFVSSPNTSPCNFKVPPNFEGAVPAAGPSGSGFGASLATLTTLSLALPRFNPRFGTPRPQPCHPEDAIAMLTEFDAM